MRDKPSKENMTVKSRILDAFQTHQGLLKFILRRQTADIADLDDLTQEVMLRALEARKRVEIQDPKNFLAGIARNLAREQQKRRTKSVLFLIDDFDGESHMSDEPSVEEIVDGRQRLEVLWTAITTLPPQCRKVFVLKHVYGRSHKEIANELNIAVSTVEKHVAHGLKRCRTIMTKERALDATTRELPQRLEGERKR